MVPPTSGELSSLFGLSTFVTSGGVGGSGESVDAQKVPLWHQNFILNEVAKLRRHASWVHFAKMYFG